MLKAKTAIVTGASRGIGLAIARALAREGVRLGLLSRTQPNVGGEFMACDLADLEQIPGAVRTLVERLGTVDFLCKQHLLDKTIRNSLNDLASYVPAGAENIG